MSLNQEDKEWFIEQLQRVRVELHTEIQELRTELHADIERLETSLLTAFHKRGSPAEARMRSQSSAMLAFDLELSDLKDRVKKIEEALRRLQ